ncbi:hypothetical protein [Herbiconiux sp. A18JL235]|uniref:Uncharacterized protein n=1 Tax=Herbiconiux sp. A18JL235 TaxID=3152363 RepID=A0AB39BCA2_9MICO
MSDHAFAIGTTVRFHEIESRRAPGEAQEVVLAALAADGFTVSQEAFGDGMWSLRYAEIGDDGTSNWSDWALEVVPLLSLVGVRRHFARCAVPVAATPTATGSRLLISTVWGFHGDGGTVGLVARRVRSAAEAAAGVLGGELRSQRTPIDTTAPLGRKEFERLTGWKKR